ncbi:SRPBCC domain-containing protein [Arenibacter troitsensis]|uniref:Activator of Hsp90 ATPase homolog 1-like protein n=1 Tax=Arenibacter troitsensis TaxID=188872 RepID=A0A1X7L3L0_9FLAO|nr:SRPBCC domain-containing protein [Arenibacter troitsensis]SMG48064.1 Activator of Hsp90 ATPase homolog 1-like protein [Arenibacter troitsensis]
MAHYTYYFSTHKPDYEIFNFLLEINNWWVGFHNETITGSTQKLGDEFSFHAGGGMHITKQKLVELIPHKKIVWLVTESKLSFLEDVEEWKDTKLIFDLQQYSDGETKVQFMHEGLTPEIACFDQCSSSWSRYLKQLETNLNKK